MSPLLQVHPFAPNSPCLWFSFLFIGALVPHLHRSVTSLWAVEWGLWGDQSCLGALCAPIESTVYHHAHQLRRMRAPTWRQCRLVLRQVQIYAVSQVLCLWPDCERGLRVVSGLLPRRTHWTHAAILLQALKMPQVWTLVRVFVTLGGSLCLNRQLYLNESQANESHCT